MTAAGPSPLHVLGLLGVGMLAGLAPVAVLAWLHRRRAPAPAPPAAPVARPAVPAAAVPTARPAAIESRPVAVAPAPERRHDELRASEYAEQLRRVEELRLHLSRRLTRPTATNGHRRRPPTADPPAP